MTVGRPGWPTLWPQVNRVVEGLRDGLGDTLGDQLVGLYLSGSLAQGVSIRPPATSMSWSPPPECWRSRWSGGWLSCTPPSGRPAAGRPAWR